MTPKTIITILAIALVVMMILASCSTKAIVGNLTDCDGQLVSCKGHRFKVEGTAPKCGSWASFTPTVNRRKINAKRIK